MGPSSEMLWGLLRMLSKSEAERPDIASSARWPETLCMKEAGAHCASVMSWPTFSRLGLSLGAVPPPHISFANTSNTASAIEPKRSTASFELSTVLPLKDCGIFVARTRRKRASCCRKAFNVRIALVRCKLSRSSGEAFEHAAATLTKYSIKINLKLCRVPKIPTMRKAAAAKSGLCEPATADATSTASPPRFREPVLSTFPSSVSSSCPSSSPTEEAAGTEPGRTWRVCPGAPSSRGP
mmetsp:Transcript_9007/g.19997  ORF Transcript_9007/g.19997 Transcript_9007/m.19997 type:complete len:239 (-) Transcript_9007:432-1148(-)